ncbi:MAG: DNA polymerase IV [Chloroflexota bacterium]
MTGATKLHVDLDAFFAAIEQRDRPELRGKPVVVGVGGATDRGVVSAASYEARRFGIHSAMPLRTAAALGRGVIFVPVDGRKYASVSRQVMEILRRFTPVVEQISIDEAFLDVAGSEALHGSPVKIARSIKTTIDSELRLVASVGVAASRLVAKVASDLEKPDGLVVVEPGNEAAFLAPLPIARLWGVGARTAAGLSEYGVRTIGDLAELPDDLLSRRFGKQGPLLAQRARGVDPAPVSPADSARSVSHEHTFGIDTSDREALERTLLALSEGVASRLRGGHVKAQTIAVKVRDQSFMTVSRQRTLRDPTDQTETIFHIALELARPQFKGIKVRLLGVAASHLRRGEQMALFDSEDERRKRATEAADLIRKRYGPKAIRRARLLDSGVAEPFERDPQTAPEAGSIGRAGRPTDDEGT